MPREASPRPAARAESFRAISKSRPSDSKYKGKFLKVTGYVEKIDADLFDEDKYVLRIGGGGDLGVEVKDCKLA